MGSNGPSWGNRHIAVRMARDAAARAQRTADASQETADRLACQAWNETMSLLGGPAQPSPTLRAAIAGGFPFLRVHCSGCRRPAWIDLRAIRRVAEISIWQLEGALACTPCRESRRRGRAVLEQLTAGPGEHGWRHR